MHDQAACAAWAEKRPAQTAPKVSADVAWVAWIISSYLAASTNIFSLMAPFDGAFFPPSRAKECLCAAAEPHVNDCNGQARTCVEPHRRLALRLYLACLAREGETDRVADLAQESRERPSRSSYRSILVGFIDHLLQRCGGEVYLKTK